MPNLAYLNGQNLKAVEKPYCLRTTSEFPCAIILYLPMSLSHLSPVAAALILAGNLDLFSNFFPVHALRLSPSRISTSIEPEYPEFSNIFSHFKLSGFFLKSSRNSAV